MRAIVKVIAVAVLASIVGCTAVQKGDTVVKYEKGELPIMSEAPATATYALYSMLDTTPKVTYALEKGDQLGFTRDTNGQLSAVAGKYTVPLANESYYWKQR